MTARQRSLATAVWCWTSRLDDGFSRPSRGRGNRHAELASALRHAQVVVVTITMVIALAGVMLSFVGLGVAWWDPELVAVPNAHVALLSTACVTFIASGATHPETRGFRRMWMPAAPLLRRMPRWQQAAALIAVSHLVVASVVTGVWWIDVADVAAEPAVARPLFGLYLVLFGFAFIVADDGTHRAPSDARVRTLDLWH